MVVRHSAVGDFARLSWPDDTLYRLRLEVGDVARGDWRSELVLDLDHVVEWVCGPGRNTCFRVAPATLTFHDVTDLRVALDWGDSGHRTAMSMAAGTSYSALGSAPSPVAIQRPVAAER